MQWAEATDCKGEVFYHDKATGFATYTHPNDAKYHEVVYVLYISIYMYYINMYVYVYGFATHTHPNDARYHEVVASVV